MKLWFVDAFTDKPYHGNPAAVTIVDEFPDDKTCQQIAAEINLSETAFVKPISENHFHIRWFTPKTEVKLCGHATLATSHILRQEKQLSADIIEYDSLSGKLTVNCTETTYTLNFPLQKSGALLNKAKIEACLNQRIVNAVHALDDVIIELASDTDVRKFQPDFQRLNKIDCRGIIITSQSEGGYDFISRFFAPRVGVLEDPVTGSAHCKLADYWQHKLNKQHLKAFQASSRGGELLLQVEGDRVLITGQAITTMQGEWFI